MKEKEQNTTLRILCASIAQMDAQLYQKLYKNASRDRKLRADRYRCTEDAYRCIAADGLLRYALGADAYEEVREAYGKPRISGREDFQYNLSHSGNWVVLAYGMQPVGVDVEKIVMDPKKERLAKRHFTPAEQKYIFQAEGAERAVRFFQIWTAKESYLKYLGTGLRRPLNSFNVLEMKQPRFSFRNLEGQYALTVCGEGPVENERIFTLEELLDQERGYGK